MFPEILGDSDNDVDTMIISSKMELILKQTITWRQKSEEIDMVENAVEVPAG